MIREMYDYEKIVINALAAAIPLNISLASIQVEPQNNDGSILRVLSSANAELGRVRVEMAFGVFEDASENMKACVWVFGDENGNLRELDFHNFAPGVGVPDLHRYALKVFPSASESGGSGT